MNFCVAILIWKMEEKKQYFWCIMLYYYFKKGKNAKIKDLCSVWRRCCDWLKVSTVVCKVLYRTMLPGQVGQLILILINQDIDWEQSTLYILGDTRHTWNMQTKRWKSLAPAWWCSFTALMFGFHVKQKKTFLTVFPHAILYLNVNVPL